MGSGSFFRSALMMAAAWAMLVLSSSAAMAGTDSPVSIARARASARDR